MAQNRKKFLGPNAGSIRDPISNAQENGRIVNPPRFAQIGGLSSSGKAIKRNSKKLVPVGSSVV